MTGWLHQWGWGQILAGIIAGLAISMAIGCLVPPRDTPAEWARKMLSLPKTIWWYLKGMP